MKNVSESTILGGLLIGVKFILFAMSTWNGNNNNRMHSIHFVEIKVNETRIICKIINKFKKKYE